MYASSYACTSFCTLAAFVLCNIGLCLCRTPWRAVSYYEDFLTCRPPQAYLVLIYVAINCQCARKTFPASHAVLNHVQMDCEVATGLAASLMH